MPNDKQMRRIKRPGRMDGGASWISYSDMMAALLLVFVLILCYSLYQYFVMLEDKTAELAQQQTTLVEQEGKLQQQQKTLIEREAELRSAQAALLEQQLLLDETKSKLAAQEADLLNAQAQLETASALLSSQQQTLNNQQDKIDALVGMRTRIIEDLSQSLSKENITAKVDPLTGNIVVESTVFFDTGKSDIKETGKMLLNSFIPVYLNVLLREEYSDYLGAIIIEGHTDPQGSFLMNLNLSQQRALSVAQFCLEMPGLSQIQRETLESIITPTGRSYASPIKNADGTINMEQSRRVEFKFSLKDSEMIDEMNRILAQ